VAIRLTVSLPFVSRIGEMTTYEHILLLLETETLIHSNKNNKKSIYIFFIDFFHFFILFFFILFFFSFCFFLFCFFFSFYFLYSSKFNHAGEF
jgi:hypothetical protein